jgi:hypothetical protein
LNGILELPAMVDEEFPSLLELAKESMIKAGATPQE